MKTKVNEVPLVGPKGRKKIIESIQELSKSAVSPTTEFTEEQEMQIRKNLGLYYEETARGEKEVKYNGEPIGTILSGYAKLNSDTPQKEDIVSLAGKDRSNLIFEDITGGYIVKVVPTNLKYAVILDESSGAEPGVYISSYTATDFPNTRLVYIGEVTHTEKIDSKYIDIEVKEIPYLYIDQTDSYILDNNVAISSDYKTALFIETKDNIYPRISVSDLLFEYFSESVGQDESILGRINRQRSSDSDIQKKICGVFGEVPINFNGKISGTVNVIVIFLAADSDTDFIARRIILTA